MEGFGKVVVRASPKRNQFAVGVVEGGDNDDGREPESLGCTEHAAQLETGRLRHHQVEEDEVGDGSFRHIHGFGTFIDHDGLIADRLNDRFY